MSDILIGNFYDLLADQLAPEDWDSNRMVRAEEALDGLQLYGVEAVAFTTKRSLEEPTKENVAAALLVADVCHATDLTERILKIDPKSVDVWQGIRLGLRWTNPLPCLATIEAYLRSDDAWAKAIALDVFLFHRYVVQCDVDSLSSHDDPAIRTIFCEALGRSRCSTGWRLSGQPVEHYLQCGLKDTDSAVRQVALRSAARCGLSGLATHCRQMSVAHVPCLNAIRFLGVIAQPVDYALLRRLATHEATAAAAVEAMGKCGAADLIPDILQAISNPLTANAAADALERISGRGPARKDPPPPPAHLTEEELDFWSEPGEPIPEAAHCWWRDNHYYFEQGRRYQSGQCVSDDPLGATWHGLSDVQRRDLYLRQRALAFETTADWEFECLTLRK